MWNWIFKNRFVILFGALGLVAGFLLNKWANRISEEKIILAIKAEIESLKNKRMTRESQQRILELQSKLDWITDKRI